MKNLFRVNIVIATCLLTTSCGQVSQVTPSTVPTIDVATEAATQSPTTTPLPSATATTASTPRPEYVPPTLIPTIEPTLLPGLLKNTFSIESFDDPNGHNIQKITGWNLGFGGGYWSGSCDGYYWLDAKHILLYPAVGQESGPEGYSGVINAVHQPVVINLENGNTWLPPVNVPSRSCNRVYWSRELGNIITSSTQNDVSTIFTYNYDGKKLASYPGKVSDVSPSGTKILMADSTVIDLQTSKQVKLNWDLEYYDSSTLFPPAPSGVWFYWTSDETRIYSCCYFYADLANGTSYYYTESDFLDSRGNPLKYEGLWMYRGQWVQNDTMFLTEWSHVDDGDIRYLPMFDPAARTIFDVRRLAGIPEDWTCYQSRISPDGKYVWMVGGVGSYLIDLHTFEAQYFTGQEYLNIQWSPNGKFAWVSNSSPDYETKKYYILSTANKELIHLPITPLPESEYFWHPTDNIVVYPAQDMNSLVFLDVSTMSYQELPFQNQETSYKISNLSWNSNGEKIAFIADDRSLWLADYPKLENLEQILSSENRLSNMQWSPDGKSVAFIVGSDIYIVDTTVK